MRIFKQMCIDLKSDILFKDTLDYIEEVFEKLGITYDSMGFMFFDASDKFVTSEKVIKKYPALEKYVRPRKHGGGREVSSEKIGKNGGYSLRVDESEHEIIRELVKKTPRPYNFGAIAIFLDNVRWFPEFPEMNMTPCLVNIHAMNRTEKSLSPFGPTFYMSNCVVLSKQFDYGKKRNPILFTIEVGDENGEIRDTAEIEKSLSDVFEKSLVTQKHTPKYILYFSDEEREHLNQLNKEFTITSGRIINDLKELVNRAEGIQHLKELPQWEYDDIRIFGRVSGLSLAKALKKVLPVKEYLHKNDSGFSEVEVKNINNHLFTLVCELTPSDKLLSVGIKISGHNFEHNFGFEIIYPNTQEELEYHIANSAAALKKAKAELSTELLRLYGKSML